MAQKVSIVLVDDLDGTEAEETVRFGLDGASYEIDLNGANAEALREALGGYVGHGRRVSAGRKGAGRAGAGRASSGNGGAVVGAAAKDVRAWARENGYEVPDRGRIPADVREVYDTAH